VVVKQARPKAASQNRSPSPRRAATLRNMAAATS
jgi:hypothetical protein